MTDPTPATEQQARQVRRDAIQDLLTRVGRGRAGADIAVHLLNYVAAEVTDGDQAREQLAAAERRRVALAEALDVHPSRDWANLINTAEDVRRGRTNAVRRTQEAEEEIERARRGEAEAVRAREAAEEGERRAMEQRQQMAAERYTWHERGDHAETRATVAERDTKIYRDRLDRLSEGYTEQRSRAERAEATLTAVRAIEPMTPDDNVDDDSELYAACVKGWNLCLADVRAALADPQPATSEARKQPAERLRCSCAGVGYGGKGDCPVHHPKPEQPADHTCPDGEPCPVPGHDQPAESECEHRSWTRTQLPGMDDIGIAGPRVCDDCGVWIDRPAPRGEQPAEPLADAVAELADAYRAYLERRRAALAEAMRTVAAAFRAGGSE